LSPSNLGYKAGLVEQTRVVIRKFVDFLIGIIESRILIERLNLLSHNSLFRYYPQNRMCKCYKFVPICIFSSLHKTGDSNHAADHAGIHNFSQGNELQVKGMLNNVRKNSGLTFSRSLLDRRCFSCAAYGSKTHKRKVLNNVIKMEIGNKNINRQKF